MSTPTTPLRAIKAAVRIAEVLKDENIGPHDLAAALVVELGLGCDSTLHQERIKIAARFFSELDDALCDFSDTMDEIRFAKQDAQWPALRSKIVGGEGVAAPGGKSESDTLPRPLDKIMDHPTAKIDSMIPEAFPDHDAQIDAISNELATEDAANDIPLAVFGNGSYQTRIEADARYPRVPK